MGATAPDRPAHRRTMTNGKPWSGRPQRDGCGRPWTGGRREWDSGTAQRRSCEQRCVQPPRVRADGDGDRRDAALDEADPAVPRTPPRQTDAAGVDAADQERAELAVLGEESVGGVQHRGAAHLGRLLAPARREHRHLALALQVDELLVEFARDDHGPVHRWQPVVQRRGVQTSGRQGVPSGTSARRGSTSITDTPSSAVTASSPSSLPVRAGQSSGGGPAGVGRTFRPGCAGGRCRDGVRIIRSG